MGLRRQLLCLSLLLACLPAAAQRYCRKVPVILAEFADEPFTISKEHADSILRVTERYFYDQLGPEDSIKFTLGPVVSLSSRQDGSNVALAVSEACRLADPEFNFSHFVARGSNTLNCVCVVFSGSRIWPRQYSLSEENVFLSLDGKEIDGYMAIPELFENELFETGIMCHEYGHVLGLSDYYDTDGEGSGGLAQCLWGSISPMDNGFKNNHSRTPAGFGAPEYHELGLGICDTLKLGRTNLEPVSLNRRYLWYPADVPGEYWLFECRKQSGWDEYIGGGGLLVYHADKSKNRAGYSTYYNITLTAEQRWERKQVNCRPDHQCMDLVEAFPGADSVNAVFFPYGEGQVFASETDPEFRAWSGKASNLAIRDIKVEADSSVSFTVIEPIRNGKEYVFQTSATICWELDESLLEETDSCVVSWLRDGVEIVREQIASGKTGKAFHTMDGLDPGTHYNIMLSLHTPATVYSLDRHITTLNKDSRNTIPFIFLGGAERNDDGSFKMGSSFPLYVYNSIGAGEIRWTFNGKEPKLNDEGLFVVEGNGTLRAEVFYEDGSCDIIAKEIIAR